MDIYVPEEVWYHHEDVDRKLYTLDCRYYNCEREMPETIPVQKQIFWDYERHWIDICLRIRDTAENKRDIKYFSDVYDLPNLLPDADGTPLGLKALLFNRYAHWNDYMGGTREEYAQQFKEWYIREYIADTKTHRQLLM